MLGRIDVNHVDFKWTKWIPTKANISSWWVAKGRLPTRDNRYKRGADLNSTSCPVCDEDQETVEHLFIHRHVAKNVRRCIFNW